MTSYRIEKYSFDSDELHQAGALNRDLHNWPVVYLLNQPGRSKRERGRVYVGETQNFVERMDQHLVSVDKQALELVRVVVDETFNKSVCLDLESQLIGLAFGDGTNEVLNGNRGIVDRNYYDRDRYRRTFDEIYDELLRSGMFERTIPEIVNSELFKYSPFKSLNHDQASAVLDIMEGLAEDLRNVDTLGNLLFVSGQPGTGKTIVAIYMLKLIADLGDHRDGEELDESTMFSELFVRGQREVFEGLRVAFVIPQQSLRRTIKNVFARTPGLSEAMVIDAFELAESDEVFDVVFVDEAHRLNQYSSQAHGSVTKRYKDINESLFGGSKPTASQLDWVRARSRHAVLLIDPLQTVRPQDIPVEEYERELGLARSESRAYQLVTQMRSTGGKSYIDYVYQVLSHNPPMEQSEFDSYEVGIVDSPQAFVERIHRREGEVGLARVVAGYAWKWVSKSDKNAFDIDLGEGVRMKWNTATVDWVNSPGSIEEAGSIHTIQGYDLNYAGVVFGADLRYDLESETLFIDRDSYFDKRGKVNNAMGGQTTTDEMLFTMITNVYAVLMTRGIKGTFIHAVDPGLREYLGRYFPVLG